MILSDVAVRRPVLATVFNLIIVVLGAFGLSQLGVREVPDIDAPTVSIDTRYPGAAASVVETRITQVLEDAISGIEGIKSIESSSSDGRSDITIEFVLDEGQLYAVPTGGNRLPWPQRRRCSADLWKRDQTGQAHFRHEHDSSPAPNGAQRHYSTWLSVYFSRLGGRDYWLPTRSY